MYYGDEIGMGDNIYLGDRNGVRTPMQWNSDRNAGFSKAVPAKLYFPVIMDPIWGYQAINVEAQQSDQSSLLHWTRNMIALRKLFQVFGRGTLEFLHPENRKILAYIRNLDREDGSHETVLCVANLSRFAQPVSLDLSRYDCMQPVEMLGYVSFPTVGKQPYPLTLAPYSFLWLELQPAAPKPVAPAVENEDPGLDMLARGALKGDLSNLLTGPGLELLQQLLPKYLPQQRWFGAKSKTIREVGVADWAQLPEVNAALVFLRLTYADDTVDLYQLPLAISSGEQAEAIRAAAPASILANLSTGGHTAILHDSTAREDMRQALLTMIDTNASVQAEDSVLTGVRSSALDAVRGTDPLPARTGSAEQSNTSILYDNRIIMKLFRRLQSGENPDTEIGRFLTEVAHFPRIAPFLGDIRSLAPDGVPTTVAMLQGLVANEGDGWEWTLEELGRFYDSVVTCPLPSNLGHTASFLDDTRASETAREHAGFYLDAAALLGRRTAEMHLALATPTEDPAFRAEPYSTADLQTDAERISAQITSALDVLKRVITTLPEADSSGGSVVDDAARLVSRRLDLLRRARFGAGSSTSQFGPAHPHPRRLPPRAGAPRQKRLRHPRLRGRAGPLARKPPPQADSAPRRRRHASLVQLRRVLRARPLLETQARGHQHRALGAAVAECRLDRVSHRLPAGDRR